MNGVGRRNPFRERMKIQRERERCELARCGKERVREGEREGGRKEGRMRSKNWETRKEWKREKE